MKKVSVVFNILALTRYYCLIIVIMFCGFIPMSASASSINKETVNLNIKSESLLNVLGEISKQTGWEVQVEKELADITVSGQYIDISLEELFRRILRGKNITLLIDDKKKRCMSSHLVRK